MKDCIFMTGRKYHGCIQRRKFFSVWSVWVLATLFLGNINAASAQNVIARAIEWAQPCSGLKVTKLGITAGIDHFKSAELETLKVDIAGDKAKIALVGSLACRTSDKADVIRGDASAKFSADADLDLKSCLADPVKVRIVSTGGTFQTVIEALKGDIQKAVEKSIAEQARILCR